MFQCILLLYSMCYYFYVFDIIDVFVFVFYIIDIWFCLWFCFVGKSYTMFGPEDNISNQYSIQYSHGVIPKACRDIVSAVKERRESYGFDCKLFLSYVEIFGDYVTDLLRHGQRCGQVSIIIIYTLFSHFVSRLLKSNVTFTHNNYYYYLLLISFSTIAMFSFLSIPCFFTSISIDLFTLNCASF